MRRGGWEPARRRGAAADHQTSSDDDGARVTTGARGARRARRRDSGLAAMESWTRDGGGRERWARPCSWLESCGRDACQATRRAAVEWNFATDAARRPRPGPAQHPPTALYRRAQAASITSPQPRLSPPCHSGSRARPRNARRVRHVRGPPLFQRDENATRPAAPVTSARRQQQPPVLLSWLRCRE